MATTATRADRPSPGPSRNKNHSTVKRPLRHRIRRDWPLVLLTLPVIVQLAVFFYTPSAYSVIAFMDYSPYRALWENPIIGFTHFQILFGDPFFVGALLNTLKFALAQLLFVFPLSIGLALLMHGVVSTMLRSVFQSIVYLPYFFSWVLVVSIFVQVLGQRRSAQLLAPGTGRRAARHHARSRHLHVPGLDAMDVERRRMGHDPLPRRAGVDQPRACTRPPPSTARTAGGGCGTSRSRASAR